jgi:hypothetical protein
MPDEMTRRGPEGRRKVLLYRRGSQTRRAAGGYSKTADGPQDFRSLRDFGSLRIDSHWRTANLSGEAENVGSGRGAAVAVLRAAEGAVLVGW